MSGSSSGGGGGISQATADAAYIPKSIVTAADDVITASGSGVPIRAGVAASRLIGKKASGGTVAITAAETLTILGATAVKTANQPVLYDASGTLLSGTRFVHAMAANTGTVTSGTPLYMTGGSGTAGIGLIPNAPVHFTSLEICFGIGAAAAVTSGAVTVTVTIYKNANSGTSNRALVATQAGVSNSTGYRAVTTTVVDAGMDAFNGSSDYFVIAVNVTASTSANISLLNIRLTGIYD